MVILIFGASGSGTTTLAASVAQQLSVKHLDTDNYYWKYTPVPFTEALPQNRRVELLRKDISKYGNVVISGSLSGWGVELTPLLSCAVRVELEPNERMRRLIERERSRFGDRVLQGGDMYDEHCKFVEWAREYDYCNDVSRRSKAQHDKWQSELHCPLLTVNSANSVEHNTSLVVAWLKNNGIL